MVAVVQSVEHQVVILGVAGSSPVSHPNRSGALLGPLTFLLRTGRVALSAGTRGGGHHAAISPAAN